MDYLLHTTQEDDRLDLLADFYYTDSRNDRTLLFPLIVAANPDLPRPLPPVLPAGLTLRIPILTVADAAASLFVFPPWEATVAPGAQ